MAPSTGTDVRRSVTELTLRDKALCTWLSQAGAGERIEYHRGYLTLDRMPGRSPFRDRAREELDRIADRAWSLAEQGLLLLAQQRHDAGSYSYFAIMSERLSRQGFVAARVQVRREAA